MKVCREHTFSKDIIDKSSDIEVKRFAQRSWLRFFDDAYKRGMVSESETMEDGVVTEYTLKFEGFFFSKTQVQDLVKLARRAMAPQDANRMFSILQIEKADVNED